MALNLYRRHGSHCLGGRALHHMTYEADELRRTWKKCSCPIYASGTLGGRFKRKNTERPSWQEAKTVAREWEAAGQWDENVAPAISPASAPVSASQSHAITIERAIAAFLAEYAESLARNTKRKYRTILKKFKEHSATKGYAMIDQWTPIDVREFRTSWGRKPCNRRQEHEFSKGTSNLR